MPPRTVLALGGGGFSMEPDNPLLDDFLLSLTGRSPPRVCFLPTASGDADGYVDDFRRAFSPPRAEPSVLTLFDRDVDDLTDYLLAQDLVYVGGGSTANLLVLWRLHGLDEALREAYRAGVVMAGISAGMNCWFEGSLTDSFSTERLDPLPDGLGLLPGSACPHFDGEALREPTYRRLVAAGELPDGWAADDGCALLFRDETLVEAVSSRSSARAFRVTREGGDSVATPVPVRYLGEPG